MFLIFPTVREKITLTLKLLEHLKNRLSMIYSEDKDTVRASSLTVKELMNN